MNKYQFVSITDTNILKSLFNIWLWKSRIIRHAILFTKQIPFIIKNSTTLIKLNKLFAKTLLAFLFRCNFLTPKWFSFMLSWLISPRFFENNNSLAWNLCRRVVFPNSFYLCELLWKKSLLPCWVIFALFWWQFF